MAGMRRAYRRHHIVLLASCRHMNARDLPPAMRSLGRRGGGEDSESEEGAESGAPRSEAGDGGNALQSVGRGVDGRFLSARRSSAVVCVYAKRTLRLCALARR